jgi:hypothetical protein
VLDMQRAAAEAQRTIAVLSPDYLDARYTQPEWAAAFARDPAGEQGRLLPVRVRPCEPAGMLPQIVYVELVGLQEPAAKQALLVGISRERAKPSTPPRFPPAAGRTVPERPRFPAALPPIWNIPHGRNPNFTGRVELLDALERALASTQAAALTQAIHGLGGVGKTQLAVEYAYRHAVEYELVWWVRAEEPATLAADYASSSARITPPRSRCETIWSISNALGAARQPSSPIVRRSSVVGFQRPTSATVAPAMWGVEGGDSRVGTYKMCLYTIVRSMPNVETWGIPLNITMPIIET